MNRLLYVVLVVSVLALVVGTAATAAYQDPRINAVAGQVAGHSVIASCGGSTAEWASFEASAGYTSEVDGFTYVSRDNVIYLAPRICQTLTTLLDPRYRDDVGPYWASLAIKALIHESVHQRGVLDEGVTDCTALTLIQQYAVSAFGYPARTQVFVYTRTKLGTYKRASKSIPNPMLTRIAYWAEQWHLALPANYQGGC